MDNRAQVTIEYLVMVAIGVTISAIALVLAGNLFGIKEGVKDLIRTYREKTLMLK